MSMMSLDVLRVCAVLQDCADQMSVLTNVMKPAADTQSISTLNLVAASQGLKNGCRMSDFKAESPLSPGNKAQADRQFVADVINNLIAELQETNSFPSLIKTVEEEKMKKAQLLHTINRVEKSNLKIKNLQKQLHDIRKEKTEECKRLEESIGHLTHQVHTMRVKSECQRSFVKNLAQQMICQGQNLNTHKENELEYEVQRLQEENEEETTVHTMMEDFLKRQHTRLQEKMQFWMKRYEKDLEKKDQEFTALQNKRANNLTQLHELSKKCRDMQRVIIEDRTEKDQLRIQLEREQRERDAAIRIQSWWRGTVVRKGLGSPKKAKKNTLKKSKKKKR